MQHKKAAVFILLGQSNAVGHGIPMEEKDIINLKDIYTKLLDLFNTLLNTPPIVLHKIVCPDRMNDMDPTGKHLANMNYINSVFDMLQKQYENVSIFDVRNAPQYVPNIRGNGLFMKDKPRDLIKPLVIIEE